MITTNNPRLYGRLCALRTHGVTRDPAKLLDKKQGGWYYEMQALGFNYRLTDIQAAIGIEQLKKLDRFVARRRAIAMQYNRGFHGLPEFRLPVEQSAAQHVYHLYVVRLQGSLVSKRKEIFEKLQGCGIGAQVHYIPIPSQPYYRHLGYRTRDYPQAISYYRSAISLPMFPKMTDREVSFVIKTVKNIVRNS